MKYRYFSLVLVLFLAMSIGSAAEWNRLEYSNDNDFAVPYNFSYPNETHSFHIPSIHCGGSYKIVPIVASEDRIFVRGRKRDDNLEDNPLIGIKKDFSDMWVRNIPNTEPSNPQDMVYRDGSVYVSSWNTFFRLNATDGEVIWKFDQKNNHDFFIDEGKLYLEARWGTESNDFMLKIYNVSNGEFIKRLPPNVNTNYRISTAITEDNILLMAYAGDFMAWNTSDYSEPMWNTTKFTPMGYITTDEGEGFGVESHKSTDNDKTDYLTAFNVSTGEKKWSKNMSLAYDVDLRGFDDYSGELPRHDIISLSEDYVFVTARNKYIVVNRTDGSLVSEVNSSTGNYMAPVVTPEGKIYGNDGLVSFYPNGTIIRESDNSSYGSFIIEENEAYGVTTDGYLNIYSDSFEGKNNTIDGCGVVNKPGFYIDSGGPVKSGNITRYWNVSWNNGIHNDTREWNGNLRLKQNFKVNSYDFEQGPDGASIANNTDWKSDDVDPVYNSSNVSSGNYSMYAQQSGVNAPMLYRNNISKPHWISAEYMETSSSNGHGIIFKHNGTKDVGWLTNNPQFEHWVRGETYQESVDRDYNKWYKVNTSFDWENNNVYFDSGSTSGNYDIGVDDYDGFYIEAITGDTWSDGSTVDSWIDNVKVSLPDGYVDEGEYMSRTFDAGTPVYWMDASINASGNYDITYAENSTGSWNYYDSFPTEVESQYFKFNISMVPENDTTPEIYGMDLEYEERYIAEDPCIDVNNSDVVLWGACTEMEGEEGVAIETYNYSNVTARDFYVSGYDVGIRGQGDSITVLDSQLSGVLLKGDNNIVRNVISSYMNVSEGYVENSVSDIFSSDSGTRFNNVNFGGDDWFNLLLDGTHAYESKVSPSSPGDKLQWDRFINVSGSGSASIGIGYNDSDVVGRINESSFYPWRYDGSWHDTTSQGYFVRDLVNFDSANGIIISEDLLNESFNATIAGENGFTAEIYSNGSVIGDKNGKVNFTSREFYDGLSGSYSNNRYSYLKDYSGDFSTFSPLGDEGSFVRSCNTTIQTPGRYKIDREITACYPKDDYPEKYVKDACIYINSSDVTLNGQGNVFYYADRNCGFRPYHGDFIPIKAEEVSNLTFEDIVIESTSYGDMEWGRSFVLNNVSGIDFDNVYHRNESEMKEDYFNHGGCVDVNGGGNVTVNNSKMIGYSCHYYGNMWDLDIQDSDNIFVKDINGDMMRLDGDSIKVRNFNGNTGGGSKYYDLALTGNSLNMSDVETGFIRIGGFEDAYIRNVKSLKYSNYPAKDPQYNLKIFGGANVSGENIKLGVSKYDGDYYEAHPIQLDGTLDLENITFVNHSIRSDLKMEGGTLRTFGFDNPEEPDGYKNISKWIEVVDSSFMNVTFYYDQEDIDSDSHITESTLRFWKHNGSEWTELDDSDVNEAENFVYSGGVTDFSIFAPLGTSATSSSPDGGGGGTYIYKAELNTTNDTVNITDDQVERIDNETEILDVPFENVTSGTVFFRIPKDAIKESELSLTKDDSVLGWEVIKEDEDFYYVSAEVEGNPEGYYGISKKEPQEEEEGLSFTFMLAVLSLFVGFGAILYFTKKS